MAKYCFFPPYHEYYGCQDDMAMRNAIKQCLFQAINAITVNLYSNKKLKGRVGELETNKAKMEERWKMLNQLMTEQSSQHSRDVPDSKDPASLPTNQDPTTSQDPPIDQSPLSIPDSPADQNPPTSQDLPIDFSLGRDDQTGGSQVHA
ncbi:hypothetical protein JCGZ_10555 [Jatropha curcas]|uniref:Uncharacterized protein n=1 Tax=Jatropha curcas TaxID=180498 RepID=A0A067KR82_JATCU|nr:hypothetical protein JCGZ_10555 [Jatropha curcas]